MPKNTFLKEKLTLTDITGNKIKSKLLVTKIQRPINTTQYKPDLDPHSNSRPAATISEQSPENSAFSMSYKTKSERSSIGTPTYIDIEFLPRIVYFGAILSGVKR